MAKIVTLADRGVVELTGEDRVGFLQGLVSNDVAQAAPGRAVWAALLTPQGKWLADFFIFADGERLLLDCERDQAAMLVRLLSRYRLRAKASLRDVTDEFTVQVGWDSAPLPEGIAAPDPRLPEAGWRLLASGPITDSATVEEWQAHRIGLGLPDGTRDLESDKTVLLEAGFDELGGVSWTKGCYMGQELTARTKYRGLLKRRLVPVTLDGPMPPSGSAVLCDGQEVGVMRFGVGSTAMALLRLDAVAGGQALTSDGARVTPLPPEWLARR